jgi:hypothetical protein
LTIHLVYTGPDDVDRLEQGMGESKAFFLQSLNQSVLTLWSAEIPNTDADAWRSGEPVRVLFSIPGMDERELMLDPRVMSISSYVESEFAQMKVPIAKSDAKPPPSEVPRRDFFNQLKALAFSAPSRHEYNIAVNNLISQQPKTRVSHRRVGTKPLTQSDKAYMRALFRHYKGQD